MPINATQAYDDQNIIARILRGELPGERLLEDEHVIVIRDINPLAPVHLLVIPKGAYVSWDDFSARAGDAEQAAFVRAIGTAARNAGLVEGGYRVIANVGANGGQEIAHLHVHVLGDRPLGPMLSR